jgi:hypothetical protein
VLGALDPLAHLVSGRPVTRVASVASGARKYDPFGTKRDGQLRLIAR